jgi:hypothetical protein
MPEIVYVLNNDAMPGMVKIGMTNGPNVTERMKDLYSTSGVPLPFRCAIAWELDGRTAREVESAPVERRNRCRGISLEKTTMSPRCS